MSKPTRVPWELEPVPGGVKLTHLPCTQYRTFHDTEWVGPIRFVMEQHACPDGDERGEL